MQQQMKVPSIQELEAGLTQMTLQRSNLKDQIEQLERQIPVIAGQIQLLRAQAEEAKAESPNDPE